MTFGKITLQSTSRMSLNDRFTGLRGSYDATDGGDALQQTRQAVQASRKNQRLAQQMEQRPAVIAALRGQRTRGGGVVASHDRGGGLLRGARGARGGGVRVGSVIRGDAQYTTARTAVTRGRGTARGRGFVPRGAARGRGFGATRGAAGSIRGINFRTGAPLRSTAAPVRGEDIVDSAAAVSVKKRLAVQGRLSQPAGGMRGATRGWVRGGFRSTTRGRGATRGGNNFSSRLSGSSYTAGAEAYQTRTFRGRGRGSRGGSRGGSTRGYNKQSYSQQWENGN